MGNFWEDSDIKRDEIIKAIEEINQITCNSLFIWKTSVYLIFELDDKSLFNRASKKVIKVTIFDYDNLQKKAKQRTNNLMIEIESFFKYYNLLMNSKSIFCDSKIEERMNDLRKSAIMNYGEDDSGLCPLCLENLVSLSLPCSHFFCEKCIKTWIGKSDSCPLCRYKIKLNRNSPSGVSGASSWGVVDGIDKEQFNKESEEAILKLTEELFGKKKN